MAVLVEMHHTGDAASQREVAALIEHMLADRPGDWLVTIVGSQGNDRWEFKITGPNAFERPVHRIEAPWQSTSQV